MSIKKTIFNVRGMHCAVCVRNVEVNIGKLPSVESVAVNLASETAAVSFDDEKLTERDIIREINALGYKASLPQNDENEGDELSSEQTKLTVALIFATLLFVISMGPMLGLFTLPAALSEPRNLSIIQLFLLIPVIICGFRFYTSGFAALFRRVPNMDTLVAIGTLASTLYSIYSTVLIFGGNEHAIHGLYFESASMIIALVMLGKFLEKRATKKTSEAVKKLVSLFPENATVIRDGNEITIPAKEILVGDTVIVRPGERIPVDGAISSGTCEVDESMITGESMPVSKNIGDDVICGCINTSGYIEFTAKRVGEDTTLAKIVRTVSEAQSSKAPIARLADTVAGFFVPAVMGIALIAAIIWALVGKDFQFVLSVFISVLVISCPCALGLATPVAIMAGTGVAAEHGILFRSGAALEHASKVNAVVFDKTGTITLGRPTISDITSDIPEDELLSLAAACERQSEHLLGKAIVSFAKEKGINIPEAHDFEYVIGSGVSSLIDGKRIFVGNREFTKNPGRFLNIAETFSEEGKTSLFVSDESETLGIIALSDAPKPEAESAVRELTSRGIEVFMLTGDNSKCAASVAKSVGIRNVTSEIKPQGKADEIAKLKAQNFCVCMVGDGINDAPALASADVSVTVSSGTDIAAEASDIILIKNDLRDIPKAITLSHAVTRNIKQNLFWAFAYNTIGIPVAAGVLYALGGPLLNPMFGAAAMSLSSISVVTNALRLTKMKF